MPLQNGDVDGMPSHHHIPHRHAVPINPRPAQRLLKQEPSDLDKGPANGADREPRPPAKRARKAINCEPCRASKLKCDRARPCSSCVLRGTASTCYQDAKDDLNEENRGNKIDPHNEIARIRQSLATLEAFIIRGGAQGPGQPPNSFRSEAAQPFGSTVDPEDDEHPTSSVPGVLDRKEQGGLYAGPTSAATHLLSFRTSKDRYPTDDSSRSADESSGPESSFSAQELRAYDDDLIKLLPDLHIIDGLVDFYFENCNWIYRHVYPSAFQSAWVLFKGGNSAHRLVLATLCVIIAVAVRYLPVNHALLISLSNTREQLGQQFYDIARDALSRYRAESRSLSLELVELLLVRTHYLTISKNDSEEIWAIRGELISLGTAMGLHRDPDKWNMSREVAERRRWAWWHIILLERWQCFLFGRPLSIASHHFDTQMPSYVDPAIDPTGRLYQPNVHLFRLAYILGDIVDDAVSIRSVAYERVQDHDRKLVNWMDTLPKELDLDEFQIARALAGPMPPAMRLGVQSIIVRTSCHHIRFTLHRPYAAAAHDLSTQEKGGGTSSNGKSAMAERFAQSLDIAVSAADKLIQLVGQSRPDQLSNTSLAVPGHVHWGPFHCFTAAMFFSFQLISNPNQPGANLFRGNIRRVLDILRGSQGVSIADKATVILTELAPLYDPIPPGEPPEEREKKKKKVFTLVKNLAFPYHDSPAYPRSHIDSPSTPSRRFAVSPLRVALSPPLTQEAQVISPSTIDHYGLPLDQMQSPAGQHPMHQGPNVPPYVYSHPSSNHRGNHPNGPVVSNQHQNLPSQHHHPQMQRQDSTPLHEGGYTQGNYDAQIPMQQQLYGDVSRVGQFMQGAEDVSGWGASVGFGHGEWQRFLGVVHRPDLP